MEKFEKRTRMMVGFPDADRTDGRHVDWALGFHPGYQAELELKQFLVVSEHENGRYTEMPTDRMQRIEIEASERGFSLFAAMSLRRQYIKQNSLGRPGAAYFYSHHMGEPKDINVYAAKFEDLTEAFLKEKFAGTVKTQKDLIRESQFCVTPDFHIPEGCIINGQAVFWIDCKTYYGSSSLAPDGRLPVGQLSQTVRKYYEIFGPGALLFLNGFSSDLMSQAGLRADQVLLLDASPLQTEILFASSEIFKVELDCPLHRVGDLLGKKGRHLRMLIKKTGCNIVIHQEPAKCQVVIASSESQAHVHAALAMVMGAIHTLQFRRSVPCPVNRVGEVIGPKGNTVKTIMRLSECMIKTERGDVAEQVQMINIVAPSIESADLAELIVSGVIEHGRNFLSQLKDRDPDTPQKTAEAEMIIEEAY